MPSNNSGTRRNRDTASRYKPQLEFANFICKFGELDLLDYANEVVLPAFLDTDESKTNRGGEYFLMNVGLEQLDPNNEDSLALVGRLVKNTQIVVEQRYDAETQRLILDQQTIDNAPSSLFVLLLFNHVLLYLRETSDAPGTEAFGNTMETFLRRKFNVYFKNLLQTPEVKGRIADRADALKIREVRSYRADARQEITKELAEAHQRPRVNIIPLANALATQDFFAQVATVKEINVRFVTPNANEFGKNAQRVIEEYYGEKQKLGADTFGIDARSDTGLNRDQALAVLDASLSSTNAHVKYEVIQNDGEVINGDDFRIRLKRPFPFETRTLTNLGTTFLHMLEQWGLVEKAKLVKSDAEVAEPEKVRQKVKDVKANYQPRGETIKE